ncbi:MAG: hypothetical protein Q9227_008479 [Pyrenula ochraceoflavens]
MSEPEVSTKSPESDQPPQQQESTQPSLIPNDTPAQTGASMGDHCVSDAPTASGSQSTGEITKFAEIECYVSKPSDYPHSPSKLLLLLTNGTGVHSLNNQLQADKFAGEGFLVVMPDQFSGDPAPQTVTGHGAEENPSLIEQVKLRAAETAKSFLIDMWLARHTQEKVLPILQKVVEAVKDEFADAVANGGGIYAVGYCFGAKYVVMLGGEHPDSVMMGQEIKDEEKGMVKKGPLIKTGAIAHATLVTREDLYALKAPISIAFLENDQLFPQDILDDGKKHLEENKIEHEIKNYSGVPHGFAVVGEYPDSKIKEAQTAAFEQMLAWLKAH